MITLEKAVAKPMVHVEDVDFYVCEFRQPYLLQKARFYIQFIHTPLFSCNLIRSWHFSNYGDGTVCMTLPNAQWFNH